MEYEKNETIGNIISITLIGLLLAFFVHLLWRIHTLEKQVDMQMKLNQENDKLWEGQLKLNNSLVNIIKSDHAVTSNAGGSL